MMKLRYLAVALLVVTTGCSRRAGDTYRNAPVIFISIDTLRADHLPAYGYRGVQTPNIDRFRADAVLFQNAYSQCPMTLPSHVSILTGLLPPENHVRNNMGFLYDASKYPSISSKLKAHGYTTGAAVSTFVLRSETGLGKAFDFYDDHIPIASEAVSFVQHQRSGFDTDAIAGKWISDHQREPFFFLFHIYEPHAPYDPPEPFKSRYRNAYDGEIATADAVVGKFLERLKSLGVYDKAIIVLLSDHGEGLMEHGEDQHGILLYREEIHVPLIIKLPGSKRGGETVAAAAPLTGVSPTVESLAGIADEKTAARSLFASDRPSPAAPIYSETYFPMINLGWAPLRSMTDDRFQYIDSPRPELYDVVADPAEKRDVLSDQRRVASSMRKALEPYPIEIEKLTEIDPEAAAKLTALGYIGAAQMRTSAEGLPNPRDQISDLPKIKEAFRLADQRRTTEAVAIFRELLGRNPKMLDLWEKLGETLTNAGEYDEAMKAYEEGIRQTPEFSHGLALSLGFVYLKTGKLDQAASYAKVGMKMNPAKAHELLARVALAKGDFATASSEAALSAGDRGDDPAAQVLAAEIQARQGRFRDALATLDAADARASELKVRPPLRLNFLRGDILARLENAPAAEQAYQREIALYPDNLQAYANLSILYFVSGRRQAMDSTLDSMVARNRTPAAYELAAKTYEAVEDRSSALAWRRRAVTRR